MTLVRELLHPPSSQQYNLTQTGGLDTFYTLMVEDKEDLSLEMEETYLRNVKNGFFIEAGASEGRLKIHKHKILPVLHQTLCRQESQTPTLSCSRRGTAGPGCWWSPWIPVCSIDTARWALS